MRVTQIRARSNWIRRHSRAVQLSNSVEGADPKAVEDHRDFPKRMHLKIHGTQAQIRHEFLLAATMTEYDFSPGAVSRYQEKQRGISRWVQETQRHIPPNPIQPPRRSNTYNGGGTHIRSSSSASRQTTGSRPRAHRSKTDTQHSSSHRTHSRQPTRSYTTPMPSARVVAAPAPQPQVYFQPPQPHQQRIASVRFFLPPCPLCLLTSPCYSRYTRPTTRNSHSSNNNTFSRRRRKRRVSSPALWSS